MSALTSTFGIWTFDPSTLWLILLQSSLVKIPSHIRFNISANSGSSLNLWLLFKTIAILIEFSQRPEFAYNNWFSFTLTSGHWQKCPTKNNQIPTNFMLGYKTAIHQIFSFKQDSQVFHLIFRWKWNLLLSECALVPEYSSFHQEYFWFWI